MEVLYLSWSQLRYFSECKRKGHLMRSGKKAVASDIRGYFPGTVVDRVMRSWLEDENRQPGGMVDHPDYGVAATLLREEQAAKDKADGIVRWKHPKDKREVAEFCAQLVHKLEPHLRELVLPWQFEPAHKFRIPVTIPYIDGTPAKVVLVGEIDILVKTEAEERPWEVWDLKATKDPGYWRKTLGQLVFYDIAVFASFEDYTSKVGLIQPMCPEPAPYLEVSNQQRVEMMQAIIAMAHDIWSENYPLAETTRPCFQCAAKNACPRFNPVGGKLSLGVGMPSNADDLLEITDESESQETLV